VTFVRSVSLSGPSEALGEPTFDRRNASTNVLAVPNAETKKPPRNCSGVASYNPSMRIPAGEDPWRIVVQHDGEPVTTLEGDADTTSVSGSASSGQHGN